MKQVGSATKATVPFLLVVGVGACCCLSSLYVLKRGAVWFWGTTFDIVGFGLRYGLPAALLLLLGLIGYGLVRLWIHLYNLNLEN